MTNRSLKFLLPNTTGWIRKFYFGNINGKTGKNYSNEWKSEVRKNQRAREYRSERKRRSFPKRPENEKTKKWHASISNFSFGRLSRPTWHRKNLFWPEVTSNQKLLRWILPGGLIFAVRLTGANEWSSPFIVSCPACQHPGGTVPFNKNRYSRY